MEKGEPKLLTQLGRRTPRKWVVNGEKKSKENLGQKRLKIINLDYEKIYMLN